jgi:glycosyltransferase involved in cell wall biosynthesis
MPIEQAQNRRLISVIVPVFNGEPYLRACIESILGQSGVLLELIVVDDGSTDGTAQIACSYGDQLRYVWQANAGQVSALNTGISLTSGAYLAFLDADDVWTPGKLARQLAVLDSDPAIDAVFGYVEQFFSPDFDGETGQFAVPTGPLPGYVPGAMLIRRSAFDRVGAFDCRWRAGEFLDWFLRAQEAGLRTALLPGTVLRRRIHGRNHGLVRRESTADFTRILKSALDRRRMAGLVQGNDPRREQSGSRLSR